MKINMTSKLYESVQSVNEDTRSLVKKSTLESIQTEELVEAEGDAICPKCGERYDSHLAAISRFDNKTEICPDCGTAEAIENMFGSVSDPHVFDTAVEEPVNEEVTIDTPTQEDLDKDEEENKAKSKEEIEARIAELKLALEDGAMSDDEKSEVQKEIAELEGSLNECEKLSEASPVDSVDRNIIEDIEYIIEENKNSSPDDVFYEIKSRISDLEDGVLEDLMSSVLFKYEKKFEEDSKGFNEESPAEDYDYTSLVNELKEVFDRDYEEEEV